MKKNSVSLKNMDTQILPLLLLPLFLGCSISKPCTEAGDVSWNPRVVGDKRCTQKTLKDGKVVNHGRFTQAYQSTGTIALEGNFEEGKKDGLWIYYAEDGHLVSVKYFDRGVEKTPPAETQKKIDLIIQQKAGMK